MNLGLPEMLIVFLLALLLFGPRKLPDIGRTIGRTLGEFRRASEDLKRSLEQEVDRERSGPLDQLQQDLRGAAQDLESVGRSLRDDIDPDHRLKG